VLSFVIELKDNPESMEASSRLKASYYPVMLGTPVPELQSWVATTENTVESSFREEGLMWNYPWTHAHLDMSSGLLKTPYETASPLKRMACFMSHYKIWKHSAQTETSILIHEHDAIYNRGNRLKLSDLEESRFDIISLNDPRGATRKSAEYHDTIKPLYEQMFVPCPTIGTDPTIPQGLPGNSAYFIKPAGAKKLIELVKEFGAWPNDAIMCKQLMPNQLGCSRVFYTRIQQNLVSTTTR
tara:strand:- start:180 stop:902 length:723 start_codon:yes stop_codon:yes gene_type:complete